MDLYKEIAKQLLKSEEAVAYFPQLFKILNELAEHIAYKTLDEIVELVSLKTLNEIKNLIENDSLSDSECVTAILLLYKNIGS